MTGGAHDDEAFRRLVESYQERVLRLAASILGPRHRSAAEDVAQEVFLRVFRGLPQFRGDASIGTWIYRIAWTVAVTAREQLGRTERQTALDEAMHVHSGDDPMATAIDSARRRAILEAMEELPHLYRSVLHLHYWLGEDVAGIAALLGAPAGTVKSYLHRGRERLKTLLKEKGTRW